MSFIIARNSWSNTERRQPYEKEKQSYGNDASDRSCKAVDRLYDFSSIAGVVGFLCAIFITIFGGWALLDALHMESPVPMAAAFAIAISIAVARGFLRYGEQACNHYIAFKLLALIRDHVFKALRKLLPC